MMQKICGLGEIEEGKIITKEVNGKTIAIAKSNNELFAFDNECTHQKNPLSDGFLEGNVIECLYHGAKFDLRTGKVKCLPATSPLKVYKTEIKDNEVFIEA